MNSVFLFVVCSRLFVTIEVVSDVEVDLFLISLDELHREARF